MFRIVISGKNMDALRENTIAFLAGLEGKNLTTPVASSQVEAIQDLPPVPTFLASTSHAETPPPPWAMPIPEGPKSAPVAASNEFGVDSRGLPWDQRIHSVSQGVNKDGSWRLRRGVEQSMVDQIEAEIRPKTTPVNIPAQPAPAMPRIAPLDWAPPAHVPAVVPAAPVAPPPQPVAAPMPTSMPSPVLNAHTLETFKAGLVPTLARLVSDGKLTQDYLQSLKSYFQVEQIWQVNDLQLAEMFENFVQGGLIAKAQ